MPATHTILLIICDRLAEVFECMHKRINRANQQLTPASSSKHGSGVEFSAGGAAEKATGMGVGEGIAGRSRRLSPGTNRHSTSQHTPDGPVPASRDNGPGLDQPTFGNLFCASTGIPASESVCSPNLFAPEFQQGYSDEEQVHMIRVLLKLQMRNFRSLLLRLDGNVSHLSLNHSNEARKSKVKSLVERLALAEVGIDNALRSKCQEIFSNVSHVNFMPD